MKVVAVEEQTFQLVCRRFSTFASQVKSICMESSRKRKNGFPAVKYVRCSVSACEVCRITGIAGNWAIPK